MMSEKRISVLLVDDHAVVRQGFRMILSAEPDIEVVGEAANGREAIGQAECLQPDVVLMDVSMPELNGIEATRRIVATAPRTRILALSMHHDAVYVREILRAGASGYLLKEAGECIEADCALRFVPPPRFRVPSLCPAENRLLGAA